MLISGRLVDFVFLVRSGEVFEEELELGRVANPLQLEAVQHAVAVSPPQHRGLEVLTLRLVPEAEDKALKYIL